MHVTVGRAIEVRDAISRSVRIVSARPLIMLPQVLLLIPTVADDLLGTSSALGLGRVITEILLVVLTVIAVGAYPSMVKDVIEGRQFSVTEALGRAVHRFWALLGAVIVVGLIVILGLVALAVPGVLFATWYAYTIPAIMLENKGALEGMTASKTFGRDKKWSTFLMLVTAAVVGLTLLAVQSILSLGTPLLGQLVYAVLMMPFDAWIWVMFSYTYLAYGPSPVPVTTDSGYGLTPPPSPWLPAKADASVGPASSSSSFCRFCGSPVPAGSMFCAKCGKPV